MATNAYDGYRESTANARWATDALINMKESGQVDKATMMNAINAWWEQVSYIYRFQPQDYLQWEKDYPEMAIRWHARSNLKDVNVPNYGKEDYQEAIQRIVNTQGYDTKEDGKYLITDYSGNIADDVTNEWGPGDFWKVGTMQSATDGIGNFLEENPLQAAGIAVSAFAPWVGPALAGALQANAALTTGVLGTAGGLLQGNSIGDSIIQGVMTGGAQWLATDFPKLMGTLSEAEQAQALNTLQAVEEGVKGAVAAEGTYSTLDGAADILRVINETYKAANNTPKVEFEAETAKPTLDAENPPENPQAITEVPPLLQTQGGAESQPAASGSEAVASAQTGTPQPAGGGILNPEVEQLPNVEQVTYVGEDGWTHAGNGIWVHDGDGTRVKVEGGPSYEPGQKAGDVVGTEVTKEEAGETTPWWMWLPVAIEAGKIPGINPDGTQTGTTGDPTTPTQPGDLVDGTDPVGPYDNTVTPGTPGQGGGILTGDTGTDDLGNEGQGGDGTDDVGNDGQGGDDGTDDGTGDDDFDWPDIPIIPIPIGGDGDDNDPTPPPTYDYQPTPFTPNVPNTDWGQVQMRPLYEVPERQMRPPPIIPAANSGQPSYEQWKEEYDRQRGLLPNRPSGVLI